MMNFQLNIQELSKAYGTKSILSSVHCVYNSGLIHGIIGANGAGKTTFFNCITHNLTYQGEISFPEKLRMGYLPTELFMYPRITGMEFIRFCLSAKNIPVSKERILSLNRIFELSLNEYAETYSTGMLKKLYLLVLILEGNNILILDEPFNGLDVSAVSYISELLQRLKEKGTLIMVSSHIVEHLCSFCDTLSLIEDGKLQFIEEKSKFILIEEQIKVKTREKFDILDHLDQNI